MKKQQDNKLAGMIRKAREAKGWSQGDLARAIGYSSRQYICMIESGDVNPPLTALKKMIDVLGMDLEQVIDWQVEMYRMKVSGELKGPQR